MSLLSRLLHILLCLALVAGGSRVALAETHAAVPGASVDAGCHAASGSAPGGAAMHHADDAAVATDTGGTADCCDDGVCACACPAAVQMVLAVPGPVLPASGPAEGPAGIAVEARGPPHLASPIRPPIG
ncbi:CopL family metal-binding regulatory protein [Lysobacter humi (ex Lee et al. 2017)]